MPANISGAIVLSWTKLTTAAGKPTSSSDAIAPTQQTNMSARSPAPNQKSVGAYQNRNE